MLLIFHAPLIFTRSSTTVLLLSRVGEFDGRARFAGAGVVHSDVERGDLPVLGVDERIKVERADFLAGARPRGGP